jgi:hypothetical protein
MKKLEIKFNPDCMTVSDVKTATCILRDLILKRKLIEDIHTS